MVGDGVHVVGTDAVATVVGVDAVVGEGVMSTLSCVTSRYHHDRYRIPFADVADSLPLVSLYGDVPIYKLLHVSDTNF